MDILSVLEISFALTNSVLIYAPLAPLILPLGALAFELLRWGYYYVILYTGNTLVETEGRVYLRAVLQLFVAIYTVLFCFIGLFALNFIETRSVHSTLQVALLVMTLLVTIAFHHRIPKLYGPLFEHTAIHVETEDTVRTGTTLCAAQEAQSIVKRAQVHTRN